MTASLMRGGPANDCPPKPSGNLPHAAAWNQSATSGVTSFGRTANTWRTLGREYSRSTTVAKMALLVLRLSALFLQIAMACTTWLATCGSGAAIGIGWIATSRLRVKNVCRDPGGPADSYDPSDPYSPKRVVKGGSFLCNPGYCESYRPSARRGMPPDTGSSHTGFRCVISGDKGGIYPPQ